MRRLIPGSRMLPSSRGVVLVFKDLSMEREGRFQRRNLPQCAACRHWHTAPPLRLANESAAFGPEEHGSGEMGLMNEYPEVGLAAFVAAGVGAAAGRKGNRLAPVR